MSGAVLEIAARLDIACPHVETVHACVTLIDRLRTTA
jgi:ketopantoate reductase